MIGNNAPEGTRVTKEILHKVKALSREQARKYSIKTIAQRRVSAEGQDGLNSFFEKRSPQWREN
jgi:methylglutaconyl-CoA hydratase